MKTVLFKKLKFPLIFIFTFLFNLFIAFGSTGTFDINTVMKWTKDFFIFGFWQAFAVNSTYPHLLNLIFYATGGLVKVLHFQVGAYENIFLLKSVAIIAFALIAVLLYYQASYRNSRMKLMAVLFLLNPAMVLNVSVQAYMDVFYLLALAGIFFMMSRMSRSKSIKSLSIFFIWIFLLVGPFLKWQFFIFWPSLIPVAIYLTYKEKKFKIAFIGLLISLALITFPLIPKAKSTFVLRLRVRALSQSFDRISNEKFVVANFGNLWQIVNGIRLILTGEKYLQDYLSVFTNPIPYWEDQRLKYQGRFIFLLVFGIFLLIATNKLRIIKKIVWYDYVLTLSLWTNVIYVLFNTSVHENHFIASVVISAFIFITNPSFKKFLLYTFFTLINFANLNFFYGLGQSGLFGYDYHLTLFNFNTSILISFSLIIFFLIYFIRFLKSKNSLLGWEDIKDSR